MKYVIGGMKYSLAKTRTSVNFAIYLANAKKRDVLLVDADPSECATEYIRWRNASLTNSKLSTVKIHGSAIKTEVKKLAEKFDDIVIDSGVGENLEYSLQVADKLIVPFSAKDLGLWTVWTLTNIEAMIDKAQGVNPKLKGYSFFVSKPDKKESDLDIISTLQRSKYLDFVGSEKVKEQMFGSTDKSLTSLKDMKEIKSSFNQNVIDIFDGISS